MGFRLGVSPDQQVAGDRIDEEMYRLITQLTNEINWLMAERGLTRADLAARMGVSPGRVSQILGGSENLTLRTLAALGAALDARFGLGLASLNPDGAYPGRTAAEADAAPPPNHHSIPRAQHHQTTRDSGGPRRR